MDLVEEKFGTRLHDARFMPTRVQLVEFVVFPVVLLDQLLRLSPM